jgi:HSP20 family protein
MSNFEILSPENFGEVESSRPCALPAPVVDRVTPVEVSIPILPKRPNEDYVLTPATAMHEESDLFVIEVDLPGVQSSNLEIKIGGRTIAVTGKRSNPKNLRSEMNGQTYRATIAIPAGGVGDKAMANFADGVLEIVIPRGASEGRPLKHS